MYYKNYQLSKVSFIKPNESFVLKKWLKLKSLFTDNLSLNCSFIQQVLINLIKSDRKVFCIVTKKYIYFK